MSGSGAGSDSLYFPTDQRSSAFYLTLFFKVYESTDSGWWPRRTPDDRPILKQDAYAWRCMEVVAQTLMEMRIEELRKNNG